MNAIMGMAELALREDMTDSVRAQITTVKQAGANLLSIINDLLDISKIESGKIQIVTNEYSLSSLINDVINIIRIKTFDSQIRFAVNVDSNIPDALIGDVARIRQVLINLLSNAVKYTEKGYVALSISGEKTQENTIALVMEIKDSGRGIKKEDIDNLFDNYFQFDIESNKGIEGVGLGLAISWNIINLMNGDISVESEYGKGSIFTVTLPQEIHKPDKLAVVENPSEKTALVFERRALYADSITKTLDNLGVGYELTSSDKKLLVLAEKRTFSHVFISHGLFERNKETVLGLSGKSQIFILVEFGESLPPGQWSTLSMPVHAISLANVLNHRYDNNSYNISEETAARFTAPEAKVLVVDDINVNLKVAQGLLSPYRMKVDLRMSGMDAIEAIQKERYDLVLMDHRMPEMDGVEATKRIRALESEDGYYKKVPIIAYTANAVTSIIDMFLESGFNEFMSKPIDTVQLNKVLEKWIPKEKQIGSAVERSVKEKEAHSVSIEGLDADKGITLSGGTVEYYFETLSTFHEDVHERIAVIAKCLEEGNLPLYVTHIHALKSASANIGADRLSEAAYALEMAAISEDIQFIDRNHDNFLIETERILNSISNALSSHNISSKEPSIVIDAEQFKAELLSLKTALEDLDIDKINQTIDTLLKTARSDDVLSVIRNISKQILLVEYDEAERLIDSLLSGL